MIDVISLAIMVLVVLLAVVLNKLADRLFVPRTVEKYLDHEFMTETALRLQGLESANCNFNGAIHDLQKDMEQMKGGK